MKMRISLLAMIVLLVSTTVSLAQTQPTYYRVAFVVEDDVLNVRAGAGVQNRIVGTLAPDATDILITGEGRAVVDDIGTAWWVPIQQGTLRGWVNSHFLTEQVASDDFCADENALELIGAFKIAIEEQDDEQFAALISDERGLFIRHAWWNTEVYLTPEEAAEFFSDQTERDWGIQDGSGLPIEGSTIEVILPLLQQDFSPGEVAGCNEVVGGPTAGLLEIPLEYSALNFFSVYRPAPATGHEFDWGTWTVGIEYVDGQPYIAYLIHYAWEI